MDQQERNNWNEFLQICEREGVSAYIVLQWRNYRQERYDRPRKRVLLKLREIGWTVADASRHTGMNVRHVRRIFNERQNNEPDNNSDRNRPIRMANDRHTDMALVAG